MKKVMHLTLFLFIVTAVCALLIGYVNGITAPVIAEQDAQALIDGYSTVYPKGTEFVVDETFTADSVLTSRVLAKVDGDVKGVLYTVDAKGYGGTVNVLCGFDVDTCTVTGIKVLSQAETAGLGANCTADWFQARYADKDASTDLKVVKIETSSPNEIQAITAATRTSNGVTNGVNAARADFVEIFN